MCIHFLVILSLKTLWAGVKHWRTAPHRFDVYRKPISSLRSRNLKVIKKMCTFEVHLCMMSGQLIFHGKVKNIAIASDPRSPFQYHQGSYYINPCYHTWYAFFFLSESLTIFPPWSVIGMGYFFLFSWPFIYVSYWFAVICEILKNGKF